MKDELEEARDKARRRSLGNIKFIGELFKLKMLTEAIMHDCVVKLLKNHDEESLECLCRLLTTIGKDLDFEKAKVPLALPCLALPCPCLWEGCDCDSVPLIAQDGPVLQSDGEDHQREEDIIPNPFHAAGCD